VIGTWNACKQNQRGSASLQASPPPLPPPPDGLVYMVIFELLFSLLYDILGVLCFYCVFCTAFVLLPVGAVKDADDDSLRPLPSRTRLDQYDAAGAYTLRTTTQ